MKRLLLLCLAWLMAVAIAPAQARTVLTVAPWGGMGDRTQGGLMEQLLAEYQALRPDIEFEVLAQIPTYEYLPKLLLMPEMPDILETHLGWFPELMAAGIPSPVPHNLQEQAFAHFFHQPLQPLLYDGVLYGLPTEYQLYALGYNRRLFDELGFGAPPTTWDELRELAAKGTRWTGEGVLERIGFRFSGLGWADGGEGQTHTFLALLWSNGGYYIDEAGRPGLDTPEALETMEFLTGMIREEIALANGWGGIPEGTTLMAVIPSWARNGFELAMGEDFANASTSLIPHGRAGFATTQYGWAFIVPQTAKNPEEAWKFLEWLTMRAGTLGLTPTGRAMARLGSIPTNPNDLAVQDELATHPFWKGFLEGLNVARPEPSYPNIFGRWKELGAALDPVYALRIPASQGLREAQERIVRALAESTGN